MNNRTMEYGGAKIKILLEDQLVDPPNEHITPVNVPQSYKPVNPEALY